MPNWYTRFIGNKVFANLLLIAVLAVGVLATISIQRKSNPDVVIPSIGIFVPYPGADPEEVDEAITRKIAAEVDGMRGVRRYQTTSTEGAGELVVEVADGYDPRNVKDRIRNAVDTIDTFPDQAEEPRIYQIESTDSVTQLFLWGELPERQLKELGESIRSEMQALPGVSLVELYHTRDYEIIVEVGERALQQHQLTLPDVASAIRASSLNQSAGALKLADQEVRVRALGKRYKGREFASIVVKAGPGGDIVTLGQLAEIRDTFEEEEQLALFNGEPCVVVDINRAPGEDLMAISRAVDRYLAQKRAELPEGVHLTKAFDDAQFVQSQLSMLSFNGLAGLILVLFILWLFLETRLAFWVAMGIPISLAGAVLVLWLMGASLNQISLVAMIIVLGIIVDDAIVVGEAIYVHRRHGKPALQAAVDGVREVGLPVLASVTTTIIAFLPMAFVSGVFGHFVFQIPLVVITALVVSLGECIFLLPAHLNYRKRKESASPTHRWHPERLQERVANGLERFVERVYTPLVERCVRRRYVTLSFAVMLLLLSAGVVAGGLVPVTVWPAVEGDYVDAYVEYPPGTPLPVLREGLMETQAALRRVANRRQTLSGEPLVRHVYVSAPSDVDTRGRISVELLPTSRRGLRSDDIIVAWQEEVGTLPGATQQSFQGMNIGDSSANDIAIWLQGDDLAVLRSAAEALKEKLAQYEGVFQITDNFRPGKGELQVTLKPAAHHLGLSLDEVSRQLYANYQGEEAVSLLRGREEVKVRVRLPREERRRLSDFESLRIMTPDGNNVPLRSVADVRLAEGVSSISGINGARGIRVSAAVDRKRAVPGEINTDIIDHFLPQLMARHPGVTWSLSGSEEENRQMLADLSRNALMAMLGIFVVLCAMFRSYLQPFIILSVIPFGLVGALIGHMALGLPISFLSLTGIVALAGVLVNDSIVLIERINAFLAEGMPLHNAVCRGGQRRFRAIFLTSISTCAGLTPLIMESDLMAQIVIPMAVSLAGGVGIGTLLTVVFLPAFLVILNDMRRLAVRLARGYWPEPEDVEPATGRRIDEGIEEAAPAA